MISTSAAYKTAVLATVREFRPRVTIVWTDPSIDTTISTDPGTQRATTCYPDQVADLIETVPYKWAHLDDTTPLSAGMHPMPGTEADAADYQVGWWGNTEADGAGDYATPQTLEIQFAARPVFELRVVGDDAWGEYPVNFTIEIYTGAGATLAKTVTVTGNSAVTWTQDVTADNLTNVTRMILSITKWSTQYRVVKISEFYSSITATYDGDDILNMNILEESELKEGTVPAGNISANEMDLTLENITNRFFPGNIDTTLYTLIKKNRKIIPELGLVLPGGSVEYIPMGVYWSGDWQTDELGTGASTSARDRMEFLRKSEFYSGELYTNMTIGMLFDVILADAQNSMPDMQYTIDTILNSADYIVANAWFPKQKHFAALQTLAAACLGRVYCDRTGIIRVEGPAYPSGDYDLDITQDDYFQRRQPANSDEIANVVTITTQPLEKGDATEEIYKSQDDISITAGQTETYTVFFKDQPCEATSSALDTSMTGAATASITNAAYYPWGADIEVNCTVSGVFRIEITGYKYEVNGERVITDRDPDSVLEFGEQKHEIKKNPLIQSAEIAQAAIDFVLPAFKQQYKDIQLDWRGDPSLELQDIVQAPEYVKGAINQRARFWTFRQQFQFDGTLRAVLEGRKIPGSEIDDIQDTYDVGEGTWQNTFDTGDIIQNTL